MKRTTTGCGFLAAIAGLTIGIVPLAEARGASALDGATLSTGNGAPNFGRSERLTDELLLDATVLRFRFAFGTDELPTAGEFKDSFTIGVSSTGPGDEALYLTVDIFGVHWLPENPGGIALPPNAIGAVPAEVPTGVDGFGSTKSFRVQAELPQQFIGRAVDLRVELFDNGNEAASRGFIDEIAVVPEPSVLALFALFLTGLITARKIRK